MSQVQMFDRFRNVSRLFWIERIRRPFANRTETTMSRADVAAQHESGGAVVPALEDIWAPGFLTNSV
jgi:hypothetical protein